MVESAKVHFACLFRATTSGQRPEREQRRLSLWPEPSAGMAPSLETSPSRLAESSGQVLAETAPGMSQCTPTLAARPGFS